MKRLIRYASLITFGALLATGVMKFLAQTEQSAGAEKIAMPEPHETQESTRERSQRRMYPLEALIPMPAALGWQVDVYPQGTKIFDAKAEKTSLLGSFIHTGSWIDLAEFRKHEGIYVASPSTIKLRGYIYVPDDSDYYFAVHFNNFAATKVDPGKTLWVACKAEVRVNNTWTAIDSRTRFDARIGRAELRAEKPIFMSGGSWHAIEASIACDLPPSINAADIAVRICTRRSGDSIYRPVRPVTPISEAHISKLIDS